MHAAGKYLFVLAFSELACAAAPARPERARDIAVAAFDAGSSVPAPSDASAADAALPVGPTLARATPDVATWSELGPPEVLVKARPVGHGMMHPYLFPWDVGSPEPRGAIVVLDGKITVWAPSSVQPVATRAISELTGYPAAFEPLGSGRGLFVVADESSVIALDAETLRERWRRPIAAQPRLLFDATVTNELVLLFGSWRTETTPYEQRIIAFDHAGNERFVIPPPLASQPVVGGGNIYLQDYPGGVLTFDGAGKLLWRARAESFTPVGGDLLVDTGKQMRLLRGATGAEVSHGPLPQLAHTSAIAVDSEGIADARTFYAFVEGPKVGPVARSAFIAWDIATGRTLWSTRNHHSFDARTKNWQVTRGEVLFVDREERELVAIDLASRQEKWHWPGVDSNFVLANDGQTALYLEDYEPLSSLDASVNVFRPGRAPPMVMARIRGEVRFKGRLRAGVPVRARGVVVRTRADGKYALDIEARGPFSVAALASGLGTGECSSSIAWGRFDPHHPEPVDLDIPIPCDNRDE